MLTNDSCIRALDLCCSQIAGHAKDAGIGVPTAARDMRMLMASGYIEHQGETKARYYTATPRLRDLRTAAAQDRAQLVDPYGRSASNDSAGPALLLSARAFSP